MALESVTNVKHVPSVQSNVSEKIRDDGLKAAQLESFGDKMASDEDLEDGEILDDDDDDEAETAAECPLSHATEPIPSAVNTEETALVTHIKIETHKDDFYNDDSNHWTEDPVEKHRGKRVRPKHHKKRHREGEGNSPHDGKRAKHEDSPFGPDSEGSSKRKRHHKGEHGKERGGKKKRKNKGKSQKTHQPIVKKKNCMFWVQGRCHKGDDCPFSHSASPEHKMELCKFYLMDSCAKNEKCLYMHSDFPCKFFHTGMKCFSKDQCKFSHQPLTEMTRAILLKHIDTAPKDILGDFPKLPRDPITGQIVLPKPKTFTNNSPTSSLQQKKIPSLFDIEIKPPPELLQSLLLNQDSVSFDNINQNNINQNNIKQDIDERIKTEVQHNIIIPTKPQGFYHELNNIKSAEENEDTDFEEFEANLMKAVKLEDVDQESDTESYYLSEDEEKMEEDIRKLKAVIRQVTAENENDRNRRNESLEESRESPSPPPPVYDEEVQNEIIAPERPAPAQLPRWQLEDYVVDNYDSDSSDDDNMLVMAASFDDDETSRDADDNPTKPAVVKKPVVEVAEADSSGIEDTDLLKSATIQQDEDTESSDDGTNLILQHLPKKQRELYLRIQQQQAQRAETQGSASKQETTEEKNEEDKKDGENWYSSDEEEEKSIMNNVLNNLSNQQPSIQDSSPPNTKKHTTSTAQQSTSGFASTSVAISQGSTSATFPTASTSQAVARDPRLIRELQSQAPNNTRPQPQPLKIKLEDTDLRITQPTCKKQDLDMRNPTLSNNKLPLNQVTTAQLSKDIDLRQLSDTDLRINPVGIPFNLPPLNVPCTEINASLSSHPPLEYTTKLIHINSPDYSKIKLDFNNPEVRNDPRLKKFVIEFDEKNASGSSPSLPRADPRNQTVSISDPRLANKVSINVISANTNSNNEQCNPNNGQIYVRPIGLLGNAPVNVNVPLRQGLPNMQNQGFRGGERGNWERCATHDSGPRFGNQ